MAEPGARTDVRGSRRDQLADNLRRVQQRLAAACVAAGRDPGEVTLIAVTKGHSAADVRVLSELGIREVAESRDQEARLKVHECADLDLRWHFVGRLQSNKLRSITRYADVVQSLDRADLLPALARAAGDPSSTNPGQLGRSDRSGLLVLLQMSLDQPPVPGRGGLSPDEILATADAVREHPELRLGGMMAVAPRGRDPLPAFQRLAGVFATLRRQDPGARILSAGMSGDLEAAIVSGATHVRVGTSILGPRAELR